MEGKILYVKTALSHQERYYYMPYLVYHAAKYSCVKLDSINMYKKNIIHTIGIQLNEFHMEKIFAKINNIDVTKNRVDLYNVVKDGIALIGKNHKILASEDKKLRKKLRNENRRLAKKGLR